MKTVLDYFDYKQDCWLKIMLHKKLVPTVNINLPDRHSALKLTIFSGQLLCRAPISNLCNIFTKVVHKKANLSITFQKPLILEKNGKRIGILAYCINNEGCTEAREKTFVGPALYNKKEVQEDLVNLQQVQVLKTRLLIIF